MEAWSRLQSDFPDSVVLFAAQEVSAKVKEAARHCARGASSVRILVDSKGLTAARYNAYWRPRAYAWEERGVLTYVQPDTTLDPDAPLAVGALWRRRR